MSTVKKQILRYHLENEGLSWKLIGKVIIKEKIQSLGNWILNQHTHVPSCLVRIKSHDTGCLWVEKRDDSICVCVCECVSSGSSRHCLSSGIPIISAWWWIWHPCCRGWDSTGVCVWLCTGGDICYGSNHSLRKFFKETLLSCASRVFKI